MKPCPKCTKEEEYRETLRSLDDDAWKKCIFEQSVIVVFECPDHGTNKEDILTIRARLKKTPILTTCQAICIANRTSRAKNYSLTSTGKYVYISCDNGHSKWILRQNKNDKCSECSQNESKLNRKEKLRSDVKKSGHTFISEENDRIIFECGSCGKESATSTSNVKENGKTCQYCQNEQRKNKNVKEEVESLGYVFVSYENNKNLVVECRFCEDGLKLSLNDLRKRKPDCTNCSGVKRKETNMKLYGVDNYFKRPGFVEEMRTLCQGIYGVDHPMQVPEIFSKNIASSYRRKSYTDANGKTWKILGYENFAIDYEVKCRTKFLAGDDENIPHIRYLKESGRYGTYFPDLYVPDNNRLVEVKSKWTYKLDPAILLKANACINAGYIYDLRVYGRNGEIIFSIVKDTPLTSLPTL